MTKTKGTKKSQDKRIRLKILKKGKVLRKAPQKKSRRKEFTVEEECQNGATSCEVIDTNNMMGLQDKNLNFVQESGFASCSFKDFINTMNESKDCAPVSFMPKFIQTELKQNSVDFYQTCSENYTIINAGPDMENQSITTPRGNTDSKQERKKLSFQKDTSEMSKLSLNLLKGRKKQLQKNILMKSKQIKRKVIKSIERVSKRQTIPNRVGSTNVPLSSLDTPSSHGGSTNIPHGGSDAPSSCGGSTNVPHGGLDTPGYHTTDDSDLSADFKSDGVPEPKLPIVTSPSYRIFQNCACDGYYILLEPNVTLPFIGSASVQVLVGSLRINGFEIKANGRWYSVFSPRIASLLTFQTPMIYSINENLFDGIKEKIPEDVRDEFLKYCKVSSTMIHVTKCHHQFAEYITNYKPFTKIFAIPRLKKTLSSSVSTSFSTVGLAICDHHIHPSEQLPPSLTIRPGYDYAVSQILSSLQKSLCPIIAVCGAPATGKSTFCRYLINTLLNSMDSVCFLEGDLGQTEFTPSGLLSLHLVNQPLLGLPFTHLQEPLQMLFYGSAEPKGNPNLYLEMLSHLVKVYSEKFQDKPLIINCNGWITDLGAALLKDVLNISHPSHLVVLHKVSNDEPLKFLNATSWSDECSVGQPVHLSPSVCCIQSDESHGNITGSKSAFNRNLTLLSYFSKLQPVQSPPLPLASLTPYKVPWSAVAVHVCHISVPFRHILYALNASVISLCRIDPSLMVDYEGSTPEDRLPKMIKEIPLCDCFGLGIIRGIDVEHKLFYVLTPVAHEVLKNVNLLMKGGQRLPSSVELEGFEDNEVPYYINSFKVGAPGSQPAKHRRYLARNQAGVERLQARKGHT